MSFLNLTSLWGFLFLLIPILLLLLMNRRRILLPWAAYEWMVLAVQKRKKQVQITDLLKLISKLLLLAALTLNTSRPFIKSTGTGGNMLCIIDNSPSMSATLDNTTRLGKAKEIVHQILSAHDGKASLFSYGGTLEPLVGDATLDKGALSQQLELLTLRTSYGGFPTLTEQLRLSPALSAAQRIMFVGDFQDTWYSDTEMVSAQLTRLGKGYPMQWIQADEREGLLNCAISDMQMSADGVFPGREAFFSVEIYNASEIPAADRLLTITRNNDVISKIPFRMEHGEKKTIPVAMTFPEPGRYSLKASIDTDVMSRDNIRFAAIDVPPSFNILAVTPVNTDDKFPYDVYFRSAARGLLPGSSLNYKSVSPLEFEAENLDNVHVVVLFKSAFRPGSPISVLVRSYLERGGSVIAFLPAVKDDEATAFGISATLTKSAGVVNSRKLKGTYLDFMQEPNLKPEAIHFYQGLFFNKIPQDQVRMETYLGVNGISRSVGSGKLILFGFMPYQGYTDLIFNPNFVQMVLRLLWDARDWDSYFSDNGSFQEWKSKKLSQDHAYTMVDESGASRNLTVNGTGDKAQLLFPPDFDPGIYSVMEDGVEIMRFGHNVDAGDSSVAAVRSADLQQVMEKTGLFYGPAADLSKGYERRDLTLWTAILLLLALALEAYAHFFRKTS